MYRQHNSPERFQVYFDESIEKFTYSRKDIVIMGDFNIDLLKCESSNYSHDFLSSLQSCYLTPAIDKPTRVRSTSATLIENIFINNPDEVVACGNLISDISDHFSQFCIFKSMKDKIWVKKSKMRDFSRFSSDRLHADLSNVNWNALFSNESSDVNNKFSSFYNKFNKLVNKHAPMKTISNRKAKQFCKPWITKGLRKSIRVKNKLYASHDRVKYKMHRNRICTLTRISQQQYNTKFFKDNSTNMKKTWEGINSILGHKSKNSKTVSFIKDPDDNSMSNNPDRIANILNEHFASVGPKLANKLPSVQRNYFEFLNRSCSPATPFAFNLVTPSEVNLEISRVPNNKSHGLYSCPPQILKCAWNVISNTLAEIIIIYLFQPEYTRTS